MKLVRGNALSAWSRLRIRVMGFSLRERMVAATIAVILFSGIILVQWAFFNQKGIWMGDLFFRKMSDTRYVASADRFQNIGSPVIVELEPEYGYRVKWPGYEWYGRIVRNHLVNEDGESIEPRQFPFWGKIPNTKSHDEESHESYFLYALSKMEDGFLEPLGYSHPPYAEGPALLFLLLGFLSPDAMHRVKGFFSHDYQYSLNEEERQHLRFSYFVGIVFSLPIQLLFYAFRIVSNWA